MTASYDRLTGYAIVSAMERDGRDLVRRFASEEMLHEAYDLELLKHLRERADGDDLDSGLLSSLELLEFTDFADIAKILRRIFTGQKLPGGIAIFTRELDRLVKTRNRVMHSRPLRRSDLPQLRESLGNILAISDLTLPASLDVSVALRTNPDYVLGLSVPVRDREAVFENLPLPDYDETGLIGREPDVTALMTLLLSSRDVISLVGEGGVGKSAVAIETLYDLLDSEANPFQAIVWTSLKTTGFGPAGVRAIRSDVVSTLTLYSDIAQTLGLSDSNGVDELITFLTLFRTLLVIDNLETINSGEIRDLLRRVPSGSKILITSRIGVGELEERYVLNPLSRQSSVQLLRSVARNLNVAILIERSNQELAGLCAELYDIPLAIKWYAGAVANGMQPKLDAADKEALLNYCFEGVYNSLPAEAKLLLMSFQFAKRPLTAAELAYLSFEVSDYRKALNLLLATSILRFTLDRGSKKTVYALTEFAAAFLRLHAPPSAAAFTKYLQRENALSVGEQSLVQVRRIERYAPFQISGKLDDRDLQVAAIFLRQATTASKASNREAAFGHLAEAMRLCPEHAEVYKISAAINAHFEEHFVADEHYRIAIDLSEDPAPIKALYAQFLLRKLKSRFLEAANLAEEAFSDDPCVASAVISMRANLYVKETARVLERANDIIRGKLGDPGEMNLRVAFTTAAEACRREAESLSGPEFYSWIVRGLNYVVDGHLEGVHDETLARTAFELLFETPRRFDADSQVEGTARLARFMLDHNEVLQPGDPGKISELISRFLLRIPDGDPLVEKLLALKASINYEMPTATDATNEQSAREEGVIHAYYRDRGFGFITLTDGRQAYFHYTNLSDISPEFAAQRRVTLTLLPTQPEAKYPRAIDIRKTG